MARDVKTEIWQRASWVDAKGKEHKCIFNDLRFDPDTVPEGLYMYQIRHDDECQGDWCSISKRVFANFWGTILTEEEIDFKKDGIDDNYVTVDDYGYEDQPALVFPEYDVITIYSENGEKYIRLEGYGYCAEDSATENVEQIYRFVEFSSEARPLKEIISSGYGAFSSKCCEETTKQYITDCTWEELEKMYFSFASYIYSSDSITTNTKDGCYIIFVNKED